MSIIATIKGLSVGMKLIGAAASIAAIGGLTYCSVTGVVDWIGDKRQAQIENITVRGRLEAIRDAKRKEQIVRSLPHWAALYCAAESRPGARSPCCGDAFDRMPARCAGPADERGPERAP